MSSGFRCGKMRRGNEGVFTSRRRRRRQEQCQLFRYLRVVCSLSSSDPGGAHSLAAGHLAEHQKNSPVHIQVMNKFAIELLSRSAAEQLSWPPSLLAEDIFQYFPAGRAGTRRQRAIFQSWHVACNRQLLSACSTHPTRRTTSLILTCTIRAFASGLVDSFASPI